MMSNNKILTVSYGTFSCTLEGFDDSFGTMKAIAEYFRDLASEDRYFGAEPPQPDAEMLARIAQKEISRRVEAREHEGKIVLSALEDNATSGTAVAAAGAAAIAVQQDVSSGEAEDVAPTQTEIAHEPVAEAAAAEVAQDVRTAEEAESSEAVDGAITEIEEDVAEAAPVSAEAEVQSDVDTGSQVVAEALSDVTDTAEAPATETAEQASQSADANEDDPAAVLLDDQVEEDTVADAIAEDVNDIVPGQPDAEVEAFFANSPAADDIIEDEGLDAAGDNAPVAAAQPAADSIAAKLQRIRAVVAQHEEAPDEDDYAEDEHAISDAAPSDVPASLTDLAEDTSDDADDVADTMQVARRDIEEALEADAQDTQAEVEEGDDIAAILDRLDRAEADEAEQAAQDSVVEADDAGIDTLIAEVAADDEDILENLFDGDDQAETAEEVAAAEDDATDAIAEVVAEDSTANEPPAGADAAEASVEAGKDDVTPTRRAPRARVIKVKRADLEAAIQSGDLEEYEDEESADDAAVSLDDLAPAKTENSSLSPQEEDELARELAELEADMKLDEAPQDEAADNVAMTLSEDMRTQDADAELLADEVEAASSDEDHAEEAASDDAQDDDQPTEEAAAEQEDMAEAAPRRALPAIDTENGADMNRLLAETDHQMEEPESATRRDAFSHLRAAVAAKRADQALGKDETVEGDDAYRNDLADVVRPRRPGRPTRPEARTPRPGQGRAAPLKLVAEQRIDVTRDTGPVRPRRVAAVEETPSVDGENFAEFAAEMGAVSLPQLLEAAAAYMAFVEGREQFSRPQLMTKVRQVGPEEGFSREDGLRHFGQLLRTGKIEKIKGGRFTVSEEIGFRPDHRAAG